MTDAIASTETGRDRVRRLLLSPLLADGFRLKRGPSADDRAKLESEAARQDRERKFCDLIADDLAYAKDETLKTLRESLVTQGLGSAKRFWPKRATILGLAEHFQPRPLSQTPYVRSWFLSRAGEAAWQNGRLLAEFDFVWRHKRGPVTDRERQMVARAAFDIDRRAQVLRDRKARGVEMVEAELGELGAIEDRSARLLELVQQGVTNRATAGAA
ncbi:MAG: hypothetical protein AAFN94_00780 [Pseudomonadota bacterium]